MLHTNRTLWTALPLTLSPLNIIMTRWRSSVNKLNWVAPEDIMKVKLLMIHTWNFIKLIFIKYVRPQSINCLFCVSFATKNGVGKQAEAKKYEFFEKKKKKKCILCQLVILHVVLNRRSFNYQCISKRKVKEFVFIPLFLCLLFNYVWIKITTFFKRRVSVILWSFSS